ncbi:MAG: hypothetical protein AAGH81_01350 [Bacteroidota bacterium]
MMSRTIKGKLLKFKVATKNFAFADLSTYNLEVVKSFYSPVFDWDHSTEDGSCFMAIRDEKEITGIYESYKMTALADPFGTFFT